MCLQVLELDQEMLNLAEQLKSATSLLMFARGFNYATALEAALKVSRTEMCRPWHRCWLAVSAGMSRVKTDLLVLDHYLAHGLTALLHFIILHSIILIRDICYCSAASRYHTCKARSQETRLGCALCCRSRRWP